MSKKLNYKYKYNIGDIIKTKTGEIKILEQIRIGKQNIRGYLYLCLIDGNIDKINEYDLNKHKGCNVCGHNKVVKGINDIATTHPHLVKYFKNINDAYIYSIKSNKKVLISCPICGYEKLIEINKMYYYGFSCKKCGDKISYPNKFALNILQQLNIEFETEYNPEWIKPKRYDFYFKLNNKEYILEMDGGWHSKDNNMSGQTKEESKAIDDYKDRLAKEHGIEVIRIDCDYGNNDRFEFIKNNMLQNDELNILFDLSNIDFSKCEEFALSNLVKLTCDLWNSLKSIVEISLITRLERTTIRTYLKRGANCKLCNYSKEESTKRQLNCVRKLGKSKGKEIKCENNNMIFTSIKQCSELSEKVFGVKLSKSSLCRVCKTHKLYKGLYFTYL